MTARKFPEVNTDRLRINGIRVTHRESSYQDGWDVTVVLDVYDVETGARCQVASQRVISQQCSDAQIAGELLATIHNAVAHEVMETSTFGGVRFDVPHPDQDRYIKARCDCPQSLGELSAWCEREPDNDSIAVCARAFDRLELDLGTRDIYSREKRNSRTALRIPLYRTQGQLVRQPPPFTFKEAPSRIGDAYVNFTIYGYKEHT